MRMTEDDYCSFIDVVCISLVISNPETTCWIMLVDPWYVVGP